MTDPRADNCRAYRLNEQGQVIGVPLIYEERSETLYECVKVELADETVAGENTIAAFQVLDAAGLETEQPVWLAWEYPAMDKGRLLPGNPNHQHVIKNGYATANGGTGPLGMYVGDGAGNVRSDVIGGLGLPDNRHVNYRLVWRERSGNSTPDTPPVTPSGDSLLACLARAEAELAQLGSHVAAAAAEMAAIRRLVGA